MRTWTSKQMHMHLNMQTYALEHPNICTWTSKHMHLNIQTHPLEHPNICTWTSKHMHLNTQTNAVEHTNSHNRCICILTVRITKLLPRYIIFWKQCRIRSTGFQETSWSGSTLFSTLLVNRSNKLNPVSQIQIWGGWGGVGLGMIRVYACAIRYYTYTTIFII